MKNTVFNVFLDNLYQIGLICLMLFNTDTIQSQTKVYITGEVSFRNYGFGVTDHTIDINVFRYSPNTGSSDHGPFSTTTYCGPYDADLDINASGSTQNNTVTVFPSAPGAYADVVDGVTVSDLTIVQAHVNNTTLITDGFKKISADVDNNSSIQAADVSMIQNVLLGYITTFNRPNWEYVSQNVTINSGFHSSPWSNVVNQGTGFTLGARSQDEIEDPSYNWRIFGFRTTKSGDITDASANSLVCGSYSLRGENKILASRSSSFQSFYDVAKIKKGTTFKLIVTLEENLSATAYEIPIFIDANKFEGV